MASASKTIYESAEPLQISLYTLRLVYTWRTLTGVKLNNHWTQYSRPAIFWKCNQCRVYTCRFDNQVLNGKLVKKYFLVTKLAQYLICEEDRKLAS